MSHWFGETHSDVPSTPDVDESTGHWHSFHLEAGTFEPFPPPPPGVDLLRPWAVNQTLARPSADRSATPIPRSDRPADAIRVASRGCPGPVSAPRRGRCPVHWSAPPATAARDAPRRHPQVGFIPGPPASEFDLFLVFFMLAAMWLYFSCRMHSCSSVASGATMLATQLFLLVGACTVLSCSVMYCSVVECSALYCSIV